MSDTFHLGLPFLEAAQAQKHVTVNEALRRLDALLHLSVASRTLASPPANPEDGVRYIVAAGAEDGWAGHEGEVAALIDGDWIFFAPKAGWRAHDETDNALLLHDGEGWSPFSGGVSLAGASGASTRLTLVEGEHEVGTGASTDTSFVIPDRAIVLGVTGVVTEAITGAASWRLGVADDPSRYGNTIGVGPGSTVVGPSGTPLTYYSATALRVTAEGSDFTGGKVRLAIHCIELTGPEW
ncbi:MAG: ribonuclease III [Alphaproteobacteria bacterium HGW-Alphaproteobacteria-3]|nr:MAG: ribonuclease III [Alphaproteobacteria bacterium HGW-Alphaproteobacteria-3]